MADTGGRQCLLDTGSPTWLVSRTLPGTSNKPVTASSASGKFDSNNVTSGNLPVWGQAPHATIIEWHGLHC